MRQLLYFDYFYLRGQRSVYPQALTFSAHATRRGNFSLLTIPQVSLDLAFSSVILKINHLHVKFTWQIKSLLEYGYNLFCRMSLNGFETNVAIHFILFNSPKCRLNSVATWLGEHNISHGEKQPCLKCSVTFFSRLGKYVSLSFFRCVT